ncbi:synaptotagmin-17 isoform X2 [Procambarus clarkii]|uniref:synaptotagmin-17 isoform X2 n=1 Tax=Procambarus clarkii TaxID=6728 RepID=UPI001E675029|nr:synaptotagmin-17-like isoform X2 [Procambarus clarkii]
MGKQQVMSVAEKVGWLWERLRAVLCWREGHSCCCCCCCCCCAEEEPSHTRKADIQYILQPEEPSSDTTSLVLSLHQHGDSDSESVTTVSLLRHQSNSSSPSSSVSSVKDLKSDIYHQIELRRSNSVSSRQLPVIDVRPIEFWSGVRGEGVQPRLPGPPRSPGVSRSPRWASKSTDYETLTKIRPNLYTSTSSSLEEGPDEDLFGRIHFSLHYDASASVLLVKVLEAADLPRPACKDRSDMAHSNPYVKISLLPDNKNSRQTTVKKKTQEPVFEETFSFELPYREVIRRTLELKVKDFDKFSRHCVVGHVLLPLQNVNLARPSRLWRPLTQCSQETEEFGEILLSLNYLPTAGRLNVDIIKAKQILQTSLARGADPYVRVSLVVRGRHLKSKKTGVKKNTLSPSFNESFSFQIASPELREASLVVTVWDWNGGVMRDEFIGRIVLGKQPSGPHEINHWSNMMGSQRHAVAQWHSLRSRQQCDEVSSASRAVP